MTVEKNHSCFISFLKIIKLKSIYMKLKCHRCIVNRKLYFRRIGFCIPVCC